MYFSMFNTKTNKCINRSNARPSGEPRLTNIRLNPLNAPEKV